MWIIMFIKYYGLNQELLGVKDEKRDIIERDNYNTLI